MLGYRRNSWLGFRRGAAATVVYAAESTALFARMSVQPDSTRKALINSLIASLKSASLWTKLDALYVLSAHDRQAGLLNWVSSSYTLTEPGGSLTYTADDSFAGDGVAKYFDTNFNPTSAAGKYVLNDSHVGIWSLNDGQLSGPLVTGYNSGTKVLSLVTRSASDTAPLQMNDAGGTVPASTQGFGHFVATRTGATTRNIRLNGGGTFSAGFPSSSNMPNASIRVFQDNTAYVAASIGFVHFGSGLTAAEVTTLYNLLQDFRAAVKGGLSLSVVDSSGWSSATTTTVPTVESANSPVEPSVIDTVTGWNGYRYWLAYNNYLTDDQKENPSVVVSTNGASWATPSGGSNPVIGALTGGAAGTHYNSDARIHLVGSTMYLFDRVVDVRAGTATVEEYFYKSSTDGVTWGALTSTNLKIAGISTDPKAGLLDVDFWWDGTQWWAWAINVNVIGSGGRMELWTAPSITGPWTMQPCSLPRLLVTNEKWWHMSVKRIQSGGFAALISSSDPAAATGNTGNSGWTYLAYSGDGINWRATPATPQAGGGTPFWTYRSTMSQISGGWDVWLGDHTNRLLKRFTLVDSRIAALTGTAPTNSVIPAITGTATEGQTLTASTGTWTASPSSYAYQWKRGGVDISGATSSTYLLVTADVGSTITVTVTATNTYGSASATSNATGIVAAAGSTTNRLLEDGTTRILEDATARILE